MTSIRGKIVRFILGQTNNLNPIKTPNPIKKIKKFSKKFSNDKVPKGFILSKEKTPLGTKFDRVSKIDAKKTGNVIYYLHGGAYISGLISFYRSFATAFYNAAETELVLLDYKTAPEYKYPSQLDEALDLWLDLINRQGYNPKNIIIGGDSAGGNLALALLLKLRDKNLPLPAAAFCMSPWADMTASGESYLENYKNDIMFGEKNKEISENLRQKFINSEIYCFVGNANRKDPYVSPVFGEYNNFPPMMFTVGGHEMLLSDTLTIVENLKANNIPVELEVREEMFHTYSIYEAFMPEAAESFNKILDFIKRNLNNEKIK